MVHHAFCLFRLDFKTWPITHFVQPSPRGPSRFLSITLKLHYLINFAFHPAVYTRPITPFVCFVRLNSLVHLAFRPAISTRSISHMYLFRSDYIIWSISPFVQPTPQGPSRLLSVSLRLHYLVHLAFRSTVLTWFISPFVCFALITLFVPFRSSFNRLQEVHLAFCLFRLDCII